jgi:acid stress-induced BolA-like protein IbaG/YrbA
MCPRGFAPVESSAGSRLGNLRQFTAGTPPSWAAAASGTGSLTEQMQDKIREGLGGADEVEVIDVSGDARHVSIRVVSKVFEGKNAINRQRLVYKCIWEEMQSERVHAVQGIVTKTPAELSK